MTDRTQTQQQGQEQQAQPFIDKGIITGREALRDTIEIVLEKAERDICIFTPTMDGYIYSLSSVPRILSHFASKHPRKPVRILVEDKKQVFLRNDRLIQVITRFSDLILIHRVGATHAGGHEMFILADHLCMIRQMDTHKAEAIVDCESKTRMSELHKRFDSMWDRSESIALTTLGL